MANPNPKPFPGPGPGRPKGSKNNATLMREAIKKECELEGDSGELAYWRAVARQAMSGDTSAMTIIAGRLEPTLQAVAVNLSDENAGFTEYTITERVERIAAILVGGEIGAGGLIDLIAEVASDHRPPAESAEE